MDLDHPDRSSVAFHVQSQSVDVGSMLFDDYMRSVAFLDAAHYPSIDFVSKSVEKVDDDTVRVTGDLTLLGVTRPLSVDVAVQRATSGGERLDFLAKTVHELTNCPPSRVFRQYCVLFRKPAATNSASAATH